jgi:hypothetical protein
VHLLREEDQVKKKASVLWASLAAYQPGDIRQQSNDFASPQTGLE